ncbi:MAG: U32 family peptidase [Thermoguttaceae bacterium]
MTEPGVPEGTQGQPKLASRLELLAPAGDFAALEAALEAGAGAVYFGLKHLNARRGAKNFSQQEFARAVQMAHDRRARAYLTLNIDLTDRELGQAARMLQWARQAKADAVLVRDPALLALRPEFPELEFHFSTQSCMANSAEVAAAGQLGADRVVLAREMTLSEIAAASKVPRVKTEVFAQGALCFCVSGRCLLSSWVGGRSGNRGTCTSPCRVPWTVQGQAAGTPLSMQDLVTIHRLEELHKAGASALKIEGRLKTASWVRQAVGLYRRALEGEPGQQLLGAAEELAAYTGRASTCGYLDGQRDRLTGMAAGRAAAADSAGGAANSRPPSESQREQTPEVPTYELQIDIDKRVVCRLTCGGRRTEWSMPKTVVRRPHKAVAVAEVFRRLDSGAIHEFRLGRRATSDPTFLLVPRAVNALIDRIGAAVLQARRRPDELVRVQLPEPVRRLLEKGGPCPANRLALGGQPDRVRLEAAGLGRFLRQVRPGAVIVEGLSAGSLQKALAAARGVPLVVALPQVFFEDEIPAIRSLLRACKQVHLPVEVNSWGGWWLARQAGLRIESGPGLPVLNSLAARVLAGLGVRCVTASVEADRRQLEELTARCGVPCSLVVFGRPPLVTTRVHLPDQQVGKLFEDRRGLRMVARRERGLCVFRPLEPFDLRNCANDRIQAAHLVVDLVGSDDPVGEWFDVPAPGQERFRFNYDRRLV